MGQHALRSEEPASTNLRESALAHAAAGWPVLPLHRAMGKKCSCGKADCRSPGKHPRTRGGVNDATTDPLLIEKWWRKWPDANIGGRLDGLVCVDVDIGLRRRAGEIVHVRGDLQLRELEAEYGELNTPLVQHTGSGSRHFLFLRPTNAHYPAKLSRDIDIKNGERAYIVMHGSNHVSGDFYKWACGLHQMPTRLKVLPDAPDWFETAWKGGKDRQERDADESDLSTLAHNRKHFDDDFEALYDCVMAVKNDDRFESRDEWLNFLAAIHFETDGSEDGRVLAHDWSDKWAGGNDPGETDHVWESFGKRSNRKMKTGRTIAQLARQNAWEPGDDKPDDDLEDEDPNKILEDDDNATRATKRLNRKHAFVMPQGKALVLTEHPDGRITWSKKADFLQSYEGGRKSKVLVSGPPDKKGKFVEKTKGQVWFTHEMRRQYLNGVVLAPSGAPEGYYNLWRGFSLKPHKLGIFTCDMVLEHIYENICQGDDKLNKWFVGWLAHCFQRPAVKPGVAVALQGKRGVGKSIIGDIIKKMIDQHSIKVASGKHLTGSFNAHLSHAIFVQVEEAFWVGDKAGAQIMKDLITGPTIRIEPKGVDSFELESFHRLLLTSNEDWVFPTGLDERRVAVLEVGDYRMQDREYFQAMIDELKQGNNGGYGALLQYFLDYDLTGIDVGQAPVTEALLKQKLASLTGPDLYWSELLDAGDVPALHGDEYGDWSEDWITIENSTLYRHYVGWHSERRYQGDPVGSAMLTKKLRAWSSQIKTCRIRDGDTMVRGVKIPPLPICRRDREDRLKSINRG
jgi:hypothetical protein